MKSRIKVISITFLLIFSFIQLSFAGSQQVSVALASTIITNARMYLNDTTATYFHSDAEMLVYLNNGTVDIVARTHCLEAIEEKTLQLNTTNYPLTDPFIVVKNVIYDSFDEKVVNGTMEANSSWSDEGTPGVNVQSIVKVYQEVYSRLFTPNAEDEGIKSVLFTTVTGTTYYYSLFVYPDDETSVNVYIYAGDNSAAVVDTDVTGLTENAWNVISGSYAETAGGAGAYISIRSPTGIAAGDWYVDNVSIYTSGQSRALTRGSADGIGDLDPTLGEPMRWAQWGSDVIIYPAPDSSAAGNHIDVYTIKRPAAVLATTAVATPAYYDKALALYIVAQALKKDAKYAQSNAVLAEYQAELNRYRVDFSEQPVRSK